MYIKTLLFVIYTITGEDIFFNCSAPQEEDNQRVAIGDEIYICVQFLPIMLKSTFKLKIDQK